MRKTLISHKDRMAARARHEEAAEWKPVEDDENAKSASEPHSFRTADAEQAIAA